MNIKIVGIEKESDGGRHIVKIPGCTNNCAACPFAELRNQPVQVLDVCALADELYYTSRTKKVLLTGEALAQPRQAWLLARILEGLGFNVWARTCYTWEQIQKDDVLAHSIRYFDTLIDGRFEPTLADSTLKHRLSTNQRIIDVRLSLLDRRIVLKKDLMGL